MATAILISLPFPSFTVVVKSYWNVLLMTSLCCLLLLMSWSWFEALWLVSKSMPALGVDRPAPCIQPNIMPQGRL